MRPRVGVIEVRRSRSGGAVSATRDQRWAVRGGYAVEFQCRCVRAVAATSAGTVAEEVRIYLRVVAQIFSGTCQPSLALS
jgi:hypothetical protein